MKKLLKRLLPILVLLGSGFVIASDFKSNTYLNDSLTYTKNNIIDVGGADRVSIQVLYSSKTYMASSFIDGVKSIGSITLPASTTTLIGKSIYINNVRLRAGIDFVIGTSSVTTAKNISNAIMAHSALSLIIVSTHTLATTAVVTATAIVTGLNQYALSADTSAIVLSGAYFTGGKVSDVSITGDTIYEPSHGLSVGLPILFTKSAGTAPTGLTDKTTYYVIPVGSNYYQLALTSTGAVAGTNIDITAETSGGTFASTPIGISGTPVIKLQGSNDGVNFSDLYIDTVLCSVSFGSPYTASSVFWDLGDVSIRYINLDYTAGTWGGVTIQAYGYEKLGQ